MRVLVLNIGREFKTNGDDYSFRSRGSVISWPMQDGKLLGAVGAWNFLFRLGLKPEYFSIEKPIAPMQGDLLFVTADDNVLSESVRAAVDRWLSNGGIVIASGLLPAWKWLFPKESVVEQVSYEFPFAAFAWQFENNAPELVCPPKWSYGRIIKKGSLQTVGSLLAVRGERQTPERALMTALENSPALIRHNNFIFLNANPFAALQAWLQGQEDLGPWLAWRHRLFWLDEQVSFLLRVINTYAGLSLKITPCFIDGLPETTLVLRHDLDNSRDVSYLESELEAGVPAVHAVLKDHNTDFWINALRPHSTHETAFHYNTAKYNRWVEGFRSKIGLLKRQVRPARREIVGEGLYKQIRWAKQKGIGISTLHRHMIFLIYPEWIDALDYVFKKEPLCLGASSLFRAQVLRWGADRSDGAIGTYGMSPDVQFPYWFPCKLSHAGLGGQALRGWETSSVMEIEPELFKQMLDYKIPGIFHRIFTVNYHPVYAKQEGYCANGSLTWWKEILSIARARNIEVKTLKDIYTRMNKMIIDEDHTLKGNT